jgi:hypothetical protein
MLAAMTEIQFNWLLIPLGGFALFVAFILPLMFGYRAANERYPDEPRWRSL